MTGRARCRASPDAFAGDGVMVPPWWHLSVVFLGVRRIMLLAGDMPDEALAGECRCLHIVQSCHAIWRVVPREYRGGHLRPAASRSTLGGESHSALRRCPIFDLAS